MTPNTPTPAATAPDGQSHTPTPWHSWQDAYGRWHVGTGERTVADVMHSPNVAHIVHCVNTHSQLLAQNAALTARCEELTKEWRDLASTDNAKYYAPINSDYERGYGDGIGFAKAYARRVLRDIADAALSRCSP